MFDLISLPGHAPSGCSLLSQDARTTMGGHVEQLPTDIPLLKISDVAAATGVPTTNLRAWERRYGFPETIRSSGGQRLYSVEQVAILRQVLALMQRGLAISQAVEAVRCRGISGADCLAAHPGVLCGELFAAFVAMRTMDADAIVSRAARVLGPGRLIEDILVPVMRRIGEDWRAGSVGIEQEHFAANWMRDWLSAQVSAEAPTLPDRLLLACVEGEQHALGLLALQVELRRLGYEAINLGADVPVDALVSAASRCTPRAVLLSVSTGDRIPALRRAVRALEKLPPPRRPEIAYGGQGACTGPPVPGALRLSCCARDALATLSAWLESTHVRSVSSV